MRVDQPSVSRNKGEAENEKLLPETRAWITQLPSYLELRSLAQHFPRIANQIASLWGQPVQCERYIDALLFNERADLRQGFPPEVCMEIMQLKCALIEAFDERRKLAQPHLYDVWGKA